MKRESKKDKTTAINMAIQHGLIFGDNNLNKIHDRAIAIKTMLADAGFKIVRKAGHKSIHEKWGIMCYRSSASAFGTAQAWMKNDDGLILFDSQEKADAEVGRLNKSNTTFGSVSYRTSKYGL